MKKSSLPLPGNQKNQRFGAIRLKVLL